jgi:hypothetical protein
MPSLRTVLKVMSDEIAIAQPSLAACQGEVVDDQMHPATCEAGILAAWSVSRSLHRELVHKHMPSHRPDDVGSVGGASVSTARSNRTQC